MNKPPDIEDLAHRFLDLWRQHLTVITTDPANADALQRMIAAFGAGGNAPFDPTSWSGMKDLWPQENTRAENAQNAQTKRPEATGVTSESGLESGPESEPRSAPGPASIARTSDGGDDAVHDLQRRVDELEARIAELEPPEQRARKPKAKR